MLTFISQISVMYERLLMADGSPSHRRLWLAVTAEPRRDRFSPTRNFPCLWKFYVMRYSYEQGR